MKFSYFKFCLIGEWTIIAVYSHILDHASIGSDSKYIIYSKVQWYNTTLTTDSSAAEI